MGRRFDADSFFGSLAINLALRYYYALAAVVLFVLRIWLPIPLWVPLGVLGFWIVRTLAGQLIVGGIIRLADRPSKKRERPRPDENSKNGMNGEQL